MNYFEYYQLPIGIIVDKKALRSAYLQKSKEVHPDIASNIDSALDQSAYNNAAYTTLNDSTTTLKYLLTIFNVEPQPLPNDFLMEMMDINEEIEEALMAGNNTTDLMKKIETIESNIQEAYQPILMSFSADNAYDIIKQASEYYLKLNYIKRLKDHIHGQSAEM